MTPFEVYREYITLKKHFTTDSYDYFKYKGKGRVSVDSFNKRKDRLFFEKLAKHKDPSGFVLASLLKNNNAWIRDIAYSEDAENNYIEWLKRKQSLTFLISEDLEKLQFPFDANFVVKDGQLSPILVTYLGGTLHLETLCVLADLAGCIKYWDKQLKDNIVWQEIGRTIKKYTPFIRYDKEKVKKIVLDFFIDAG